VTLKRFVAPLWVFTFGILVNPRKKQILRRARDDALSVTSSAVAGRR